MDRTVDQRGIIKKDGNMQINSATIQNEEITIYIYISMTCYKTQHIIATSNIIKIEGGRSRGRPKTTWITDLTNSTEAKYCQRKSAADDQKDGMVS